MTKRVLVILIKRLIEKNIGAYVVNVKNSIVVRLEMLIIQAIMSAGVFRLTKFEFSDIMHASD